MEKTQEPKYRISNHGEILNRASGEKIPDDEPIMIFRARDVHAADMIHGYLESVEDEQHKEAVRERLFDFVKFSTDHPERMKEPDTEISG